jgi:RNA polymerase sigma factor (TIGR02999 family)
MPLLSSVTSPDERDPGSLEPLWTSVYQELRRLADHYLAHERRDHTLQPTALVNETFLRLQSSRELARCDRLEFCRAAASAMRRVLVDHARHRLRHKRRHAQALVPPDELFATAVVDASTLLDVEQALTELETISARRAEIVRLRFFAGLAEEEVAELLGISRRTVQSEFRSARAWLRSVLARDDGDGRREVS